METIELNAHEMNKVLGQIYGLMTQNKKIVCVGLYNEKHEAITEGIKRLLNKAGTTIQSSFLEIEKRKAQLESSGEDKDAIEMKIKDLYNQKEKLNIQKLEFSRIENVAFTDGEAGTHSYSDLYEKLFIGY